MDVRPQPTNSEETARVLQQVAERSASILGEFAKKDFAASMSSAAGD